MRNKMKSAFGGKKLLKIIGTSTLAVAMALSLTGCGTKTTTTKPSPLVIWGFVDEDVFNPIIKDFKNQNKGVEVKYYKKTLDSSYENNSLNSILSGQGPDVWAIPNDWVFRHKDKLAAMSATLLTNKNIIPKDYFAETVIQDNVFDNQIYGLTPTIDILQVYYNPIIFDNTKLSINRNTNGTSQEQRSEISQILNKFPITWNEFNKIIPFLTVKNGNNIQTAGAAMGTINNVRYSQDILSLLMLQNQTKMLSGDLSQATFNLPVKNAANVDVYTGKNTLDFFASYSNPGSTNYTWNASMPNDVEAFVQGKVAMIFGYTNTSSYLRQVYPNFQFQQALMPQIGDIDNIIDYAHYTSYVVPSASPNAQTAWKFVGLLSTDDAQTYRSATKEIASKKVETEVILRNRGATIPTQDQIKTAQSWNKGRYPVEVDTQLKQSVDRVVAGSQSSQASLDTAAANITELLRKQTW